MHESLISYINKYSGIAIDLEEEQLIREAFKPKALQKHQYFLQEGDVCKYYCFIVKGAMRQYYVDEKGIEHVISLGIEQWWMGDRESIVTSTPTRYNIDAWENCKLLTITQAEFERLRNRIPAVRMTLQLMEERNSIANQSRLNDMISLSALSRYTNFVREHPEFLQRFPLHIIASHLGVTKETLSRIRKDRIL